MYKHIFRRATIPLLLAAVLTGPVQAAEVPEGTRVTLKASALVNENTVRLHHVAEITGENTDLVMKLASLPLCPAPSLGQSDQLDKNMVREKLERRRWAHGVVLDGAVHTDVTRACTRISEQKLKQIGLDYLHKHMPWKPGRADVTMIRANEVLIPQSDVHFQVTPQRNEDFIGEVLLLITVRGDDGALKQTWWRGHVTVTQDIVVASRYMEWGHIIANEDVSVRSVVLNDSDKGIVSSPAAVVGKKLRRRLKSGEPVKREYLDDPPLISKGDVVTAVAESKFLRVSIKAVAREEGCKGDTIRVMNMSSRKEFLGTVTGSSLVRVVY